MYFIVVFSSDIEVAAGKVMLILSLLGCVSG